MGTGSRSNLMFRSLIHKPKWIRLFACWSESEEQQGRAGLWRISECELEPVVTLHSIYHGGLAVLRQLGIQVTIVWREMIPFFPVQYNRAYTKQSYVHDKRRSSLQINTCLPSGELYILHYLSDVYDHFTEA